MSFSSKMNFSYSEIDPHYHLFLFSHYYQSDYLAQTHTSFLLLWCRLSCWCNLSSTKVRPRISPSPCKLTNSVARSLTFCIHIDSVVCLWYRCRINRRTAFIPNPDISKCTNRKRIWIVLRIFFSCHRLHDFTSTYIATKFGNLFLIPQNNDPVARS